MPISAIASPQWANPTEETMKHTQQLLDYLVTQEEAVLTYNSSSEMILAAHNNASYLSEPNARSQAGGHFFLSNNAKIQPNNGAVLNIAHVIKHVMTSATEAELAALYIKHQSPQSSVHHTHYPRRNGTQTITNTTTNQQCHGRGSHQWQDCA
jgi:hypothetical protein